MGYKMVNSSQFFLIIALIGLLVIALILMVRVIIEEIKGPPKDQLILFILLGIIITFLIPFTIALIQYW